MNQILRIIMDKINQLIKKYCINGIVYKNLNEVMKMNDQTIKSCAAIHIKINDNIEFKYSEDCFISNHYNYFYYLINNDCSLKFIYYYFLTVNDDLSKLIKNDLSQKKQLSIDKFKIPILPLLIQEEIVKILDTFVDYQIELEKEMIARKKQYEYYRNQLFNFNR